LGGSGSTRVGFAGDCTAPCELFVRGLPDEISVALRREKATALVASLDVRCRRCENCLRHRQQLWAARARDEVVLSGRTWFGTLTLSPESYMRSKFAAELYMARRGHKLEECGESDLFKATVQCIAPEITLWLKRIRKNSGAALRYIIVCEAHKTGVPHWHVLVHENEGKVGKRVLDHAWRLGYSQFRLVDTSDERTSFYVTKYLSKSALTRVRASADYGRAKLRLTAERIEYLLSVMSDKQIIPNPLCKGGTPERKEKETF
jgi:hypothetical protein